MSSWSSLAMSVAQHSQYFRLVCDSFSTSAETAFQIDICGDLDTGLEQCLRLAKFYSLIPVNNMISLCVYGDELEWNEGRVTSHDSCHRWLIFLFFFFWSFTDLLRLLLFKLVFIMILSFCIKAKETLSLMKQISRQYIVHKDDVTDSLYIYIYIYV